MRAGHSEDVRGAIHESCGKRLAAKSADIHVFLFADLHRVETWWLTADGMYASRSNFDVFPISEQASEKSLGDGTATNITCADKEDVFHNSGRAKRAIPT
jgi:hypothetical protein